MIAVAEQLPINGGILEYTRLGKATFVRTNQNSFFCRKALIEVRSGMAVVLNEEIRRTCYERTMPNPFGLLIYLDIRLYRVSNTSLNKACPTYLQVNIN
jgi:hypothetical protein